MNWARWLELTGVLGLILVLYFLVPVSSDPQGGPVMRGILAVVVLGLLVAGWSCSCASTCSTEAAASTVWSSRS